MVTTRTLAAGLCAALGLTAPLTASAADLYGDNRHGYEQPYDDYAEGEGNRRYDNRGSGYDDGRYEEPRYDDQRYGDRRYEEPRYGYQGSTKDGDYLPPVERAPRFSDERGYGGRHACIPRWQIRKRLQADGWHNFQRLGVRPNVVIIRAMRPNGRAFDLKLDRCSGAVIAQRPARFPGYGVYGPGPRRYGWAY